MRHQGGGALMPRDHWSRLPGPSSRRARSPRREFSPVHAAQLPASRRSSSSAGRLAGLKEDDNAD